MSLPTDHHCNDVNLLYILVLILCLPTAAAHCPVLSFLATDNFSRGFLKPWEPPRHAPVRVNTSYIREF